MTKEATIIQRNWLIIRQIAQHLLDKKHTSPYNIILEKKCL